MLSWSVLWGKYIVLLVWRRKEEEKCTGLGKLVSEVLLSSFHKVCCLLVSINVDWTHDRSMGLSSMYCSSGALVNATIWWHYLFEGLGWTAMASSPVYKASSKWAFPHHHRVLSAVSLTGSGCYSSLEQTTICLYFTHSLGKNWHLFFLHLPVNERKVHGILRTNERSTPADWRLLKYFKMLGLFSFTAQTISWAFGCSSKEAERKSPPGTAAEQTPIQQQLILARSYRGLYQGKGSNGLRFHTWVWAAIAADQITSL